MIEEGLKCAETLFKGQIEIRIFRDLSSSVYFSNRPTRNSQIMDSAFVFVRVACDKKLGIAYATINREGFSFKNVIEMAIKASRLSEADAWFKSLPRGDGRPRSFDYSHRETTEYSLEQNMRSMQEMAEAARAVHEHLNLYASHHTHNLEFSVGNSEGIQVYAHLTRAYIHMRTSFPDGSADGNADQICQSVKDLHYSRIGEIAAQQCVSLQHPKTVNFEMCDAVLEPSAVSSLVKILGFLGFSGYDYIHRRSFLCRRRGEKIVDEKISLYDDGNDQESLITPFDFEGVLKQKCVLIERGIARDAVYDSYTAHMVGKKSTGHSTSQHSIYTKPFPTNLFLERGHVSLEEMIENTRKGILIPHLYFGRDSFLSHSDIQFFGKSWYIEHGEVKYPLKEVCIGGNLLEFLSSVDAIGTKSKTFTENTGLLGGWTAPAMKLRNIPLSCPQKRRKHSQLSASITPLY